MTANQFSGSTSRDPLTIPGGASGPQNIGEKCLVCVRQRSTGGRGRGECQIDKRLHYTDLCHHPRGHTAENREVCGDNGAAGQ